MSVLNPVIDHIDTALERIFLAVGVVSYHPVTDIYTEVRNLRRTNEALRKFPIMVTAEGNKPKGGGKFTSRYAIFNNGYRVVPQDATHALYISGEQITDDGQSGPACIDTSLLSPGTNVTIHYEPPASELVRADAELAIIARAAYLGVVAVDVMHGIAGTATGTGTHATPSNNISDAMTIAASLGIEALAIHGALTLTTGNDVSGIVLRGENALTTQLTIQPGANVAECQFEEMFIINSTLDGNVYLKHCYIAGASGLDGFIENSVLAGAIALSGLGDLFIIDCKSGAAGTPSSTMPVFDFSGLTGAKLIFRNWAGPLEIINSTSATNIIVLDINSAAHLKTGASNTAGTVYVRGICSVENTSTMTLDTTTQIDKAGIGSAVWSNETGVEMAVKLAEAWGRLGLDPSKPLNTGQTSITFGQIVMALTGDSTNTTVTRQL